MDGDHTLACLRRTVPAAVPGIYFLSGGQDDVAATASLNAMNARALALSIGAQSRRELKSAALL